MSDSLIGFSFIPVNGVTLHCAEAGPDDGPLVVLLHGFPEFWFAWREYFAPLAKHGFRVVAPDQRGYNLSSKPESPDAYRLDLAAADVFGAGRRRWVATGFHVVGHDWGAAVAWTMAGLEPKRLPAPRCCRRPIRRSGSSAMRTDPDQRHEEPLRADSAAAVAVGNDAEDRELRGPGAGVPDLDPPDAFSPEILDRYREAWRQPGALTGMLNWYRALYVAEPPTPAPGSLIPPTLVLWGDRDDFAVSAPGRRQRGSVQERPRPASAAGVPLGHPRRAGRRPRRAARPSVKSGMK